MFYKYDIALFSLTFLGLFMLAVARNMRRGRSSYDSIFSTTASKFAALWYMSNLYAMFIVGVLLDPFISIFLLSQILVVGVLGPYVGASFHLYALRVSSMVTVVYVMFVSLVSMNSYFAIIAASYFASWLCLQTVTEQRILKSVNST